MDWLMDDEMMRQRKEVSNDEEKITEKKKCRREAASREGTKCTRSGFCLNTNEEEGTTRKRTQYVRFVDKDVGTNESVRTRRDWCREEVLAKRVLTNYGRSCAAQWVKKSWGRTWLTR